jgi:hypothetical protein
MLILYKISACNAQSLFKTALLALVALFVLLASLVSNLPLIIQIVYHALLQTVKPVRMEFASNAYREATWYLELQTVKIAII